MLKTILFLFTTALLGAPAAFADVQQTDEIAIQCESETMQTNHVTKLPEFSYDVPDILRPDFADAFEASIGSERDVPTLLAKAMNVIDRMIATGRIERRYYEVVIGESPSKRLTVQVQLSSTHYGELGYRAYSWATDNKTGDGRDMPEWVNLPERIQQAWTAAASAIRGAA